jgi:hypothetical protein
MRVTRRLRREDDGAVLLIVAICMVVLLGMAVLTMDLGRMVAVRRSMVRSADSAVLAAAQQCALANGEGAAMAAADVNAGLNEPGVGRVFWQLDVAECAQRTLSGLHSARLGYEQDLDMFFAPIFGIDTATVNAGATAVWGPAANASIVPITVDFDTLMACYIPADPDGDGKQPCTLEYHKDTLQNPRWGELDLSQWGDPDAADLGGSACSVSASDLTDAIVSGGVATPADYPPETWDCLDNGLSYSVWKSMEGRYLTFPVMDLDRSTGKVVPNSDPILGDDCTGADIPPLNDRGRDCRIDTAYIVGFVCLFVTSVQKKGPDITVITEWRGACTSGGIPCLPDTDCYDFGVHAFRLVD